MAWKPRLEEARKLRNVKPGNIKAVERVVEEALDASKWEERLLSPEELALLLNAPSEAEPIIWRAACATKEKVYSRRVVISGLVRARNALSEAGKLLSEGYHRLALDARGLDFESTVKAIRECYEAQPSKHCYLGRIDLLAEPFTSKEYSELSTENVGAVIHDQQSFIPEAIEKLGRRPEKVYEAVEEALSGGMDDFFIHLRLGLEDPFTEALLLRDYVEYLINEYSVGPRAIILSNAGMSEERAIHVASCILLALPFTQIGLDSSWTTWMRQRCAGRIAGILINGAFEGEEKDQRNLYEVVRDLVFNDIPVSWCSACYRAGRTGPLFLALSRRAVINKRCKPNAVMSMIEYALDFCEDRELREKLFKLAEEVKNSIDEPRALHWLDIALEKALRGERDLVRTGERGLQL